MAQHSHADKSVTRRKLSRTRPLKPSESLSRCLEAKSRSLVVFDLLDITPYGRQETWKDSPEGWPQQPPYDWMRLADSY